MKQISLHSYSRGENVFSLPTLFNELFSSNYCRPGFHTTGVSTPAVNVIETRDEFTLEMVAPGMKKEAFQVMVQGDTLTITYDHEDNRSGERRDWRYRTHEYNYHSFTRSFVLPKAGDVDKINAKYEDGILKLVIPKMPEAIAQVRQINITDS